ncbi:MAG TPA: ribonuclease HI [Candidatus Paceibacterota bacterium]|nr:ribonuclease HI [Candidatus Paceibacterota bacterium]HMP19032.1 ribonuclease HI [Candidatus Paceibacterota bacterium]HMP85203.1 ribonuclease HI [Candidatus Paceibacterota bacterium]
MNNKILIFTDGASRGNPGPGGWGAIIVEGNNIIELGGDEIKTTNNRMEIMAAYEAIKKTPIGTKIKIFTDSAYLINGITKWVFGWMKNNWLTIEKKEVLNKDLWEKLFNEVQDREIQWCRVKGHAGIDGNNRADKIATSFGQGEPVRLFRGDRRNYEINVNEPNEDDLAEKSDRDRRSSKAYSYLSLIDGKLEKHKTWEDCKSRVDGAKGAKFRKAISAEDEIEIIKNWGVK